MSRVVRNDIRRVFAARSGLVRQARSRACLSSSVVPIYSVTRRERSVASSRLVIPQASSASQRRANATIHGTTVDGQDLAAGEEAPKPPLAIVFTDIVKSTAIWENDSSTMSEAMNIHDDLIRALTKTHAGYEVKQNGDGFMIAFQSPVGALKFCLDVQMQLQEQEWPEELLKMGPAKLVKVPDSDNDAEGQEEIVLWKGLRLRMSAHFGEPVCKWNEIIQRMDYLGPAVNRAARFVSVCEGGQIVVSQEFLEELKKARRGVMGGDGPLFVDAQAENHKDLELDLGELQAEDVAEDVADTKFEIRMLGERHFKGVAENQRLFFIVPKSLHGRLDYFPQHKYVQASKGNLTA